MPELAEVDYYRRQWLPAMGQKVCSVVNNMSARVFKEGDRTDWGQLVGSHFKDSFHRGKNMLFAFGKEHWLGVHLGMTGELRCEPKEYEPIKHDHLLIITSDHTLVYHDPRKFGALQLHQSQGFPDWWSQQPPDLLSDAFQKTDLVEFLMRRGKSPIKAVLLMQERFPGIGNWMADEILWRARITPTRKSASLSDLEAAELYQKIRQVCRDAMRVIAPDWGDPPDTWLFNHRWSDGGSCPKTGAPLERIQVGGRTTCWSPKWQK